MKNKLINFLVNIKSLVHSLFTERIAWHYSIKQSVGAIVDKKSAVAPPYRLKNVSIGFGTAIGQNSRISITTIGKFCSIGPNFLCGWGIHPIDGISINPAFYSTARQNGFTYSSDNKVEERKPISIGNDVFIGANVTVLDGVTIGDGAVVGAGAVVSKNLPPYSVSVGCPIKIIKYRFHEATIERLLAVKWWDKDERVFQMVEKHFFDPDAFLQEFDLQQFSKD
jgi:virginiamycin A acetyltransferase